MPRPQKWRVVCGMPNTVEFGPPQGQSREIVILSIDQYETIRLIDLEGLTQEECAKQMNVARTTVQSIYDTARRIIADAIVYGKTMKIEGGAYKLCDEQAPHCGRGCKMRHGRFDKLEQ
jgi:predicted DNA-binding protein (UPF0251 family)